MLKTGFEHNDSGVVVFQIFGVFGVSLSHSSSTRYSIY